MCHFDDAIMRPEAVSMACMKIAVGSSLRICTSCSTRFDCESGGNGPGNRMGLRSLSAYAAPSMTHARWSSSSETGRTMIDMVLFKTRTKICEDCLVKKWIEDRCLMDAVMTKQASLVWTVV